MDIQDWRRRIDAIDVELVALLNERARCALHIGHLKQAADIPVYDPNREDDVLEHAVSNSGGPLTGDAIRRLFERIIDESRSVERHHVELDSHADTDGEGDARQGNG